MTNVLCHVLTGIYPNQWCRSCGGTACVKVCIKQIKLWIEKSVFINICVKERKDKGVHLYGMLCCRCPLSSRPYLQHPGLRSTVAWIMGQQANIQVRDSHSIHAGPTSRSETVLVYIIGRHPGQRSSQYTCILNQYPDQKQIIHRVVTSRSGTVTVWTLAQHLDYIWANIRLVWVQGLKHCPLLYQKESLTGIRASIQVRTGHSKSQNLKI